jgi:hypothetical protein
LQTRLEDHLAGHPLSLSLLFPLSYPLGHKEWGGARGKSCKDCTPSLSLTPATPTPNQRRATTQVSPRAPPASACSTLASIPLSQSPRPPRAHSC